MSQFHTLPCCKMRRHIQTTGANKRYCQKLKFYYYWQDTCGKKCHLLFFLKIVFPCCFEPLKKVQISNFNEISLLNKANKLLKCHFLFIWWAKLLNFVLYDPPGIYLSGSIFFIAPTRSKKTTIILGTFVTGVKPTSWCLPRTWFMLIWKTN